MIIEVARQMARIDDLYQRYPIMPEAPYEVRVQLSRLERIIRGGCAVRALEKAFSIQAADAEYDLWFLKQDEAAWYCAGIRDEILRAVGRRGQDLIGNISHEAEVIQFSDFINSAREHGDTPLAEAIRGHAWRQRVLPAEGIVNLSRRGNKVLHIADDHVAYVGVRRGRRLVRLSDPDQGPLAPQSVYDCFVFSPKAQAAA